MGRVITVTAWPGASNPEITVNGFGFQLPIGQQVTVTDAVYQELLNIQVQNAIVFTDGGAASDPTQAAEVNADIQLP